MAQTFSVPAGLFNHALGIVVALASVALGTCVIEKHFTLSRADGGSDGSSSMEPDELRRLVDSVRTVGKALGRVRNEPTERERPSRAFRRSLFAVEDVREGERFTSKNVRSIRPDDGLHPRHLDEVLGAMAVRDVRRGTPLSWEVVRWD